MKIKFFRWYGGKIRLVEMLKLLIPEHVKYVELLRARLHCS